MRNVNITINGRKIAVPEGVSVLQAATDNGIYIPNLCAIQGQEPQASCRLCFVEVRGKDQPVTACTESVTEGTVIETKSERTLQIVRAGFALLMASHPVDCTSCCKNRLCELQKIALYLHTTLKPAGLRKLDRGLPLDDSHPDITMNPNKCVLCGRCVWVCRQKSEKPVLGFAHRGFKRVITTFGDEPLGNSRCHSCTACALVCPTGALTVKQISDRKPTIKKLS